MTNNAEGKLVFVNPDADGVDNPGPYYDAATDTEVVPSVIEALTLQ